MLDFEPAIVQILPPSLLRQLAERRRLFERTGLLLFAVTITLTIILLRDQMSQFAVYGYGSIFLVNLLGNATLILPVPSFAAVFVAGSTLNPVAVGALAGLGGTLGEMTGYLAGVGGRSMITPKLSTRLEGWISKGSLWGIFLLAALPNPLFDIAGMMAGAARMPVWRFLLATCAGKTLRLLILAFSGWFLFGA